MASDRGGVVDAVVLVVGGAGFVGSNLVLALLGRGARQVVIVDNLLSSDPSNIPDDPRVRFVFGSINEERCLSAIPPEVNYVFHLACFHGNQSSIADPLSDHENNARTSLSLFHRLRGVQGLQTVVYAAAACAVATKTFDDPEPTTEEQPVSLFHDSPYSISKIIGELYGNYYYQRYGLPVVKARFSNVYGPREILGAGRWRGTPHTVWRNVIPTFIWRSLAGEELPLDNGGNTSRDFIFVEDMVRGLIACALRGDPGGIYNLATGRETSILRLAKLINELTGNTAPLDLRPARDWDRSGKRFASTLKSERDLAFRAEVPLEEGLRRTVDWTRANADLVRQCIANHSKLMAQAK